MSTVVSESQRLFAATNWPPITGCLDSGRDPASGGRLAYRCDPDVFSAAYEESNRTSVHTS